MGSSDVDMYFDDRNTARATRGRFRYQDECVALRCIDNLASGELAAVIVEWSTDYIATFPDRDPELVSVKHRDPGTGEWTTAELRKPLRDLHHVWREMRERCSCAFVSSAGVTAAARKELAAIELPGAAAAERRRFLNALSLPSPPLPRRSEITTIGISAMGAALRLLHRDERYARDCYLALLRRIERAAIEEPADPVERLARLTGSLRSVAERGRPSLSSLTLLMQELRELVLRTESAAERRTPVPIRAAVVARPRADREVHINGEAYRLVGDPVETGSPDGSYQLLRTDARPTARPDRDVRLAMLNVVSQRGPVVELGREAELHESVAGLPPVLARESRRHTFSLVTALPPGAPLLSAYGLPPYPRVALDALVNGLPHLGRTLSDLHAGGGAHRALRPAVLFASRDRLWLRDAGLAATPIAAGEGPPEYRAPEQDRPILVAPGPATDVYQLAAIVYHLTTGTLPGLDPAPPGLLRPDLSPAWEQPLLAALSSEPEQRPDMRELVHSLVEALRAGGTTTC